MIKLKKINNEVVLPMEIPEDDDRRKPRGESLISAPYANIYVCARKATGKSNLVMTMLKKFVGPETKVHIFSSTVYTDPKYIQIGKWFDKHHIEFYPSTSIYDDDGHDLLADILKEDEDFYDLKDADDLEPEEKPVLTLLDLNPKPKEKRKKRSKYKELRRVFVFDDLSGEIRWSKSLKQLLKKNRHLLAKTIISSQALTDLDPQSINQLDIILLLKYHSDAKIRDLYDKLDLSISYELFLEMYKFCTKDKKAFDFLYIHDSKNIASASTN